MPKKENAIANLRDLSNRLNAVSNESDGESWKATLNDYLRKYLGNDSSLVKRLDDLEFVRTEYRATQGMIGRFEIQVYDDTLKQDFRNLIENAIRQIDADGVYKNPNSKNFLSSFENPVLITGLFAAAGVVFFAGVLYGGIQKDREILEVKSTAATWENKYNDLVKKKETADTELKQATRTDPIPRGKSNQSATPNKPHVNVTSNNQSGGQTASEINNN